MQAECKATTEHAWCSIPRLVGGRTVAGVGVQEALGGVAGGRVAVQRIV